MTDKKKSEKRTKKSGPTSAASETLGRTIHPVGVDTLNFGESAETKAQYSEESPIYIEAKAFSDHFSTSITPLGVVKGYDLSPRIRDIRVDQVTFDAAAPGRRTMSISSSTPSISALAELITTQEDHEAIINYTSDEIFLREVFKNIFPSPYREIQINSTFMMISNILRAVTDVIGRPGDIMAPMFMTGLLTLELAPLKITARSRDLALLMDRPSRFIGLDFIETAFRQDTIDTALTSFKPGVPVPSNTRTGRISQDVLIANIVPRWQNLSRGMIDATRLLNYVNDTLYLLRAYIAADQKAVPAPQNMMVYEPLQSLATNLTLVLASFDSRVNTLKSAHYELKDAIQYFSTVFHRSPKLSTQRLSILAEEIGHTTLTDKELRPKFAAIYSNLVPEGGRSQATHLQNMMLMDNFASQVPLPSVEARLDAILDPVLEKCTPASAASLQIESMTSIVDLIEQPVVSRIAVDHTALLHYAAYLSRRQMIIVEDSDLPRLLFDVSVKGFNFQGPGVVNETLLTDDPLLAIMLSPKSDTSRASRPPVQTIAEEARDKWLSYPTAQADAVFTSLRRRIKLSPMVATESYAVVLETDIMLGIEHIPGLVMYTRAPINEITVSSFFESLDSFISYIDGLGKKGIPEQVLKLVRRDAALMTGMRMASIWDNPVMDSMASTVMTYLTMSNVLTPEARRRLRSNMMHKHLLIDLYANLLYAFIIRMNLVPFEKVAPLHQLMIEEGTYHHLAMSARS